jgi:hypothetical protein
LVSKKENPSNYDSLLVRCKVKACSPYVFISNRVRKTAYLAQDSNSKHSIDNENTDRIRGRLLRNRAQ